MAADCGYRSQTAVFNRIAVLAAIQMLLSGATVEGSPKNLPCSRSATAGNTIMKMTVAASTVSRA